MSSDAKQRPRSAFLRMERDKEFAARLKAVGVNGAYGYFQQALDDLAWSTRQMQRRIVEDVA